MSMKKTYTCDICRKYWNTTNEAHGELFGVYFKSDNDFQLDHLSKTDGVHICLDCVIKLKREFERESVIHSIKKAAPVQHTTTA